MATFDLIDAYYTVLVEISFILFLSFNLKSNNISVHAYLKASSRPQESLQTIMISVLSAFRNFCYNVMIYLDDMFIYFEKNKTR